MAKRSRYSFSSLNSYNQCAAAWRECYGTGPQRPSVKLIMRLRTRVALLGRRALAVFDAIANCLPYYRDRDFAIVGGRVDEGAMNHEGIRRYAEVCWAHKPKPVRYDREAGYKIADSYPEPVRSTLTAFMAEWQWTWGDTITVEGACPVEQELSAFLPSGKVFSGHLDLLRRFEGAAAERVVFGDDDSPQANADVWRITDFKTRRYAVEMVRLSDDVRAPEWPLQLLAYAWLVQRNYPEARNFELQFFTLQGFPDGPWTYSGDLAWVGAMLDERFAVMDADTECEPRMGEHCHNCFYRHVCPLAGPRLEAFAQVTPLGWAEAAAFFRAQANLYEGFVRASVDSGGPEVVMPGGRWGYNESAGGYEVVNYGGMVDVLTRGAEKLANSRARLAPVARALKQEKDVLAEFVPVLLADEELGALTSACVRWKPGGARRWGFYNTNGKNAAS